MAIKLALFNSRSWYRYFCQRISRQRNCSNRLAKNIVFILAFFISLRYLLTSSLPASFDKDRTSVRTPFDEVIPSNSFDLFWTVWNTDDTTFRLRRLLVIDSIFIHHPQATIIVLSPTLNDTELFLPYRRRGYKIYCFDFNLDRILEWNWYVNDQLKDFLRHWNTEGIYFKIHINDYVRAIALYLYGGTFIPMDTLILQPLPRYEFIGLDQLAFHGLCTWCIQNTSGFYVMPSFMRFLSQSTVLHEIMDGIFNRQFYNESCLNCPGIKGFTDYVIHSLDKNYSEPMEFKLLEPYRLYPFKWDDMLPVFTKSIHDASLEVADLMKRSYAIRCFKRRTDQLTVASGSLADLLFDRLDLSYNRPKLLNNDQPNGIASLNHLPIYIYTSRKQGRFLGRDVIYFKIDRTLADENIKWSIDLHVTNGTLVNANTSLLTSLNQAEINTILNEISYEPGESTLIDTLYIHVKNDKMSIRSSLTILIFSKWVTFLVEPVKTNDRWPAIKECIASIDAFFPETVVHVVNHSNSPIYENILLNFNASESIDGYELNKNLFIINVPNHNESNVNRNSVVNTIPTPYFFVLQDNFTIDEHIHIDILLELMYSYRNIDIVAGEVIEIFEDSPNTISAIVNGTREIRQIVSGNLDSTINRRVSDRKYDPGEKSPCYRVDIFPDVFMGRRETLRSVEFDDFFTNSSSEDLFDRLDATHRSKYNCRALQNQANQVLWWTKPEQSRSKHSDVL